MPGNWTNPKVIAAMIVVVLLIGFGTGYLTATYTIQPTSSKQPISIGLVLGLSGRYSYGAQQALSGARMAIQEINDGGGVLGRPLELIAEDDRGVVADTVSGANKLIDVNGVHYLLSTGASGGTLAIMPIALEKKVVLLNFMTSSPAITNQSGIGGNPWTFTLCPDEFAYARAFASLVNTSEIPANSFSFLAYDMAWGRDACAAYVQYIEAAGGTITSTNFYDPASTEFTTILTKIKAENPGGIITMTTTESLLIILKQANELGITLPVYNRAVGLGPALIASGGNLTEGLYGMDPWYAVVNTTANTEFLQKFKLFSGTVPEQYWPWSAYETIHALGEAIQKAGSDDAEAVRTALTTIDMPSATGGSIKFDEHNAAHNYVFIAKIRNQQVTIVTQGPG